jgi:hypothetical protein
MAPERKLGRRADLFRGGPIKDVVGGLLRLGGGMDHKLVIVA